MDATGFRDLYAYTFWADREMWACVEQLTDEQFARDLGYSRGAPREQCIHIMAVEYWWPHFLRTGELHFLRAEDYPTRAAIRAKWDEVEREATAYLAGLTPSELERDVRPDAWDAEDQPIKLWQALVQVANHSTDHRAQVLAGLKTLGAPTFEQDYLTYIFARRDAASAG
ncbi:MAG TPA: DinB family protein [Ktedonobacterales bacterium]|jgi:uncharacterized damage-inducible protein DinB